MLSAILGVVMMMATAVQPSTPPIAGMDNRACLGCHGIAAFNNPTGASIYVDGAFFNRSMHGKVACRDCHTFVKAYPHGPSEPVKCETCHDAPRRIAGDFHKSDLSAVLLVRSRDGVYVVAAPRVAAPSIPDADCVTCHARVSLRGSMHEGRRCVECHRDATPVLRVGGRHAPMGRAACHSCHLDEGGNFARTVHGARSSAGDTGAATCATCHGGHAIKSVSDPSSPVNPANVSQTCLKCHGVAEFARVRGIDLRLTEATYTASVHGRPDAIRGLAVTATCVDCHGAHTITGRKDPASSVNYQNLGHTCGRCHATEAAEYEESVHGRAAASGAHDAPACSDCHGEHAILPSSDPRSTTHRLAIAQQLCLGCHDRPALAAKYGLSTGRGASYLDSFHGLATRGQSTTAAVCTDCHGTHRILGDSDSLSTLYPANRQATCGRCHPKASPQFATGMIHFTYGDHWLTNMIRWFYRFMIAGTLGGMLAWVALLTLPAIRRRWASAASPNAPVRFLRTEVIQHILLLVSFITLCVTGFALAFPDAGWVQGLALLGLHEALRSILHRIAGTALVAVSAWHLVYLVGTARGRWLLRRMMVRISDVFAARDHILWAIGKRPHPPHLSHFAYFEKAEYWALLWGTFVMAATGGMLWFPEALPRLWVAVAETIHFYEALLAAGAILIWHMYFVLVDPEIFPLNPAIFRGRPAPDTELADRTERFEKKEK